MGQAVAANVTFMRQSERTSQCTNAGANRSWTSVNETHVSPTANQPALHSRLAAESAGVAQARDSVHARQSGRPHALHAGVGLWTWRDASAGRRHVLHYIPRSGHGVLEHDDERDVRIDVFEFFAHARAAH